MMCHCSCGRTLRECTETLDQWEKLFRDANVSDDAVSALKHFRCDAFDRLKCPPSKKKSGSESCRDLQ